MLETQTYVQRSGNTYEYLTNEEQVIEEEIKNVDIDGSEVSGRLFRSCPATSSRPARSVTPRTGRTSRSGSNWTTRPTAPRRSCRFTSSPRVPLLAEEIRMHSAGKDELRVTRARCAGAVGPAGADQDREVHQGYRAPISAIEGQILQTKGAQNTGREKELIERVKALGRQVHPGDQRRRHQLQLAGRAGPGDRWFSGADQPHLHPTQAARRPNAASSRSPGQPTPTAACSRPLKSKLFPPSEEVLSFVLRKESLGEQVTVKTIVDSFTAKPYGWDLARSKS